ncbi:hypothetical protein WJU23_18205 [Prosthecobacter sp. SYSU 5D2]|uniref:hypothetical protein n=1 Tax=Prosthecobacter sp. SYSU 5D2 TaxID=3134134 RepID=UPI0031FED6D5
MRYTLPILALMVFLCACGRSGSGTPAGFIDSFGSHASPSGAMTVEVTRREKSLVDFAVVDTSTGKTLVTDYIGSDAMRWFLWWENPSRLWGYGSDLGYFKVFDFASGRVTSSSVSDATPVPQFVWDHLPTSKQRRYRVAPALLPEN